MRRSLGELQFEREVPDADAVRALPEHLENRGNPLDRLDQVGRLMGCAHRFVLRNSVLNYTASKIFVKGFLRLAHLHFWMEALRSMEGIRDKARVLDRRR